MVTCSLFFLALAVFKRIKKLLNTCSSCNIYNNNNNLGIFFLCIFLTNIYKGVRLWRDYMCIKKRQSKCLLHPCFTIQYFSIQKFLSFDFLIIIIFFKQKNLLRKKTFLFDEKSVKEKPILYRSRRKKRMIFCSKEIVRL